MAFKERLENSVAPKAPDAVDLKLLKQTVMPGAAGMTWGELYERATADNELEPNEDFFSFVKRIKKGQEEDSGKPRNPARKAA
jgi:hypothetical protein